MRSVKNTCRFWLSFLAVAGLMLTVAAAACAAPPASAVEVYGAEANPTGNPIGGGAGYSDILLTGDFIVQTKEELLQALARAKPGQVVYVQPDAVIDLTGTMSIMIPPGVTLAGNRGHNGAPGPLLFTDDLNTRPLFRVDGANARITGIRIQGPNGDIGEARDEIPRSAGIQANNNVEVDNTEIYNWAYAGVIVSGNANKAYIHHNYIHHCRRTGLGYLVVVHSGYMLIEANIFDYYRHAIAGTGVLDSGYEARYNLARENAVSHAFDMHGGGDYCPKQNNMCSDEEKRSAGDWISIHHNTFLVTEQTPIVIRGVPRRSLEVHHNWFIVPEAASAFRFTYFNGGNTHVHNNVYGPEKKLLAEHIAPQPVIRAGNAIGRGPIVALASSGESVSFGFTSLPPAAVKGELPIAVEIKAGKALQIDKVEILLDGNVLYSSPQAPEPGELVVDTYALADGLHQLTLALTVGDPQIGTISETATFSVQNWWRFTDELQAPLELGWLGRTVLTMTNAESDGWRFVDGRPEDFGGDESRRVSTSTSEEWMTWETPNLQTYKVVVYTRSADQLQHIKLAVSDDEANWSELSPAVGQSPAPTAAGWHAFELSGQMQKGTAAHYFRLSVAGDAAPDDIQIGAVSCAGIHR